MAKQLTDTELRRKIIKACKEQGGWPADLKMNDLHNGFLNYLREIHEGDSPEWFDNTEDLYQDVLFGYEPA